jgi:hypothetical protein
MEASFAQFARTAWRLTRGDGSIIARRVQLRLGGRVQFNTHPNEHYWTVRNGNLCFLNQKREVTTEFVVHKIDENGRRVLRGRFLHSKATVTHVLTEIPPLTRSVIPNPPPRVAVLVRTHLVNEKLEDLLGILSDSECYDLFVCADCTNGELEFDAVRVLRHRDTDALEMGLSTNKSNLLWYCGDYALYFAYTQIPDYDYYFMIEYDVDFRDRTPLVIEGIINRLEFSQPSAVHFLGCQSWQGNLEMGWGRTIAGIYPEAHLCLFPFVVASRQAIEYLIAERQAECRTPIGPDRLMFCEAFVPSALMAGGFRRVDINSLVPGAVHGATFRIASADNRGPMLLGHRYDTAPSVKLLHPVYDEKNFIEYHLRTARHERNTTTLATLLGTDSGFRLSPQAHELLQRGLEELREPEPGV